MRCKFSYYLWPWAVLLLFCSTVAAEPLKLATLQSQAVAKRHLIQKYATLLSIEEQTVQIGRSPLYPRLDTSYRIQQLDAATPQETRASSRLQAGLSYNLYAGGRHRYGLRAAELNAASAAWQLQAATFDLRLQVALRYLDCFESYQRWRITAEEERLLQRRYDDAWNRFQVGLIRRNDLLKIQVELDFVQQNKRSAEADYHNRLSWLAYEIDGPLAPGDLDFADLNDLPQVQSDPDWQTQMLSLRSEIKALELAGEALDNQVKVAGADTWPQVDLALIHARYGDNYGLGAGSRYDDDTRVQVNLSFNLFDGFRTRHTRTRAQLAAQAGRHDLAELKQHLLTRLNQILVDYQVAVDNLTVAEAGIAQARENLRVTDVAYREGLETAADLLDAVFLVSRAEFSYTRARASIFREYYRLLRMVEKEG